MSDDEAGGGAAEKRKRKRKHGGGADKQAEKAAKEEVVTSLPVGVEAYNNDRTLYIEGLPFTATEDNVKTFFASEEGVKVVSVRLPKWHDSGRLRGYGHVEFANAEMATKCLALDGCDMMNRYIKVARPMTPRLFQEKAKVETAKPMGCRSVYVKNIPYDTTEDELKEVLKVCGPIVSIRLAKWEHTEKLKGFGYVDFVREDSAEIAVKKSTVISIRGRPILIDYETGKAKAGFKNFNNKK